MAEKDGAGTGLTDQSGQVSDMLSNFASEVEGEGKTAEEIATEEAAARKAEEGKTAEEIEAEKATAKTKEGEAAPTETEVQIKTLQEQIKALNDQLITLAAGKAAPAEGKVAEAEKPTIFFKDKAEFDAIFEKPEALNELLNKVSTDGATKIIRDLPRIVRNMVQQQITMQTQTAKFFADNKDLLSHRQFASFVANDMIGRNPSWTLDQLYKELGKEVRTRLGLKAGAVSEAERGKGNFPATKGAGARYSAGKGTELSPLEKDIQELVKD